MINQKKIQLLMAFLLVQLFHVAHAQKFTSKVSSTFEKELSNNFTMVGNRIIMAEEVDKNRQFAFSFKLSKLKFAIKLYSYDADGKLVKENAVFNGERKFGPLPSSIKMVGDKPYLIYTIFEEKETTISWMASEIDPVSLAFSEAKPLLSIDYKKVGLMKVMEFIDGSNYVLQLSPDKSRVLCLWSSGLDNQYSISVLDAAMNPIWNTKESVLAAPKIKVTSATVTNNGTVYVSYKPDSKDEYDVHVAVCSPNKKPKDHAIKLQTGRAFDALLVASQKDNLVHVTGTFSGASDFIDGVYYQSISADGKLDKAITTNFSEELLKHLDKVDPGSWAITKAKKHGTYRLKNMKAFELEDGSVSMIGEFRRVEYNAQHQAHQYSGSLINARFVSGTTAKVAYIPKFRISSVYNIGDSYFGMPYKNQLLVFYNDHKENLTSDVWAKGGNSHNYKKSVLAVATIDAEGNVKRESVLDLTADSFLPIGDQIVGLTQASLLIPISRIKNLGSIDKDSKWATISID